MQRPIPKRLQIGPGKRLGYERPTKAARGQEFLSFLPVGRLTWPPEPDKEGHGAEATDEAWFTDPEPGSVSLWA